MAFIPTNVGLEDDKNVKPVSHEGVVKVFLRSQEVLRNLIVEVVRALPEMRDSKCESALKHARLSA